VESLLGLVGLNMRSAHSPRLTFDSWCSFQVPATAHARVGCRTLLRITPHVAMHLYKVTTHYVACWHDQHTNAGGGGAAESVCPPAHELAWGYDVVITTFQRLSSDWSMRSDPRLAERLVLLKVSDV
jgi:hypothetical protein